MTRQDYAEEYEREPNFLSDTKMLNTAMTRAKSLVLVVGDPDCLVQSKIGQKWERYLEECHKAGKKSLICDSDESEAIREIVVASSNLNAEADEFLPSAADPQTAPICDLPPARMVEASTVDCRVESSDGDESESCSSNSGSWEYTEDDSSDPDIAACLEPEDAYQRADIDHDCSPDMDQPVETLGKRHRRPLYHRHRRQAEMLGLLQADKDRYVRCILKVTASGEDAYGVVRDPEETDILLEGRLRRNRAFDGEEVLVKLLRRHDEDQDNSDGRLRGQVVGIFSHKRPSQFICQLYENTTHKFVPLDRGQPIVFNRRSERNHANCKGCVVLYNFDRNPRGKIYNIEEKSCVQLQQAVGKLFIVQYLSWSDNKRYPLGIVSDFCDHGTTYKSGERVLSVQFSIPENPVRDTDKDEYPTTETRKRGRVITEAFTIDPEQSKDLDDALSVTSCDADHEVYEVGVFIADVSHFVSSDSSLDKYARDIGMTVYDESGRQKCPMLPKHLSSDVCSLLPDKNRPVLAVFQKYNSETGQAIDTARFERRNVKSCCKLSYTNAEMIIKGSIPHLNCNEATRADVIRQVKILYRLSRTLRQERLGNAMHYRDVDRTKDTLARELVEEFMIRTNRTVAERLLHCCPGFTPLVCQWEPKQQMLEQLLKRCGNLVATSGRLSVQIRNCGVTSYQMLVGKSVCPRLHITKTTLKLIQQACSSSTFQDVVAAVCTEGFHPQLALANSKFIRSQQKAIYVCSAGNDESVLRHSHLGCLYTHFTSPIRRYIDLVCHRLVRKYLLRDNSGKCQYNEEEMKEICDHATFRRVNMRKYLRELELLQFSCQIYKHPIATVAVIEEISGNYIDLFVPFCPHMPGKNSRLRVSVLNASGCNRNVVDGVPRLTVSWSIGMLPADKKRRMELPEDQYCTVNSELWKRLVSLVTTPGTPAKQRYDSCQEIIANILTDSKASGYLPDRALPYSTTLDATVTSATTEAAIGTSGNDVGNPLAVLDSNGSDEEDGTEWSIVSHGRGRERPMPDSRQQASTTPKQHQRLHVTAQKQLRLFDLVSIQLSSKPIRGLLRPTVQLINFPSGISVCVEHNSYPSDCFADVPSMPGILLASKRSYHSLDDYRDVWMPLLDIESATGSIRNSSTGMSVLIHNFQVTWAKRGNKIVGSTNLDFDYASENKIACQVGDYVCLRYFDIPFSSYSGDINGEGATVELLRSRSSFNLVSHCQICSSSSEKSSDSTGFTFGRYMHVDVPTDSQKIEEKCEEIFVDLVPFHQEICGKKALLSVTEKRCTAQMIHLGLPYR